MTIGERLDAFIRLFQFRGNDGRFKVQPLLDQAPPGEVAFADPRRLFKGSERTQQWNPSMLVGVKGLRLFDEMRRDDQIKAAMAFKKHSCLASGWQVSSPEGQPPDWAPTRFLKYVFEHMDPLEVGTPSLDRDLFEMLSCLDYGFSVTEKIYDEITEGEWKGHVALTSMKTRAPYDIVFAQDVYGNLADDGIIQHGNWAVPGGRLPRAKFVLMSYQSQFGNPFGTSDLEAAYTPWWSKVNTQKWLAMLLERLGIPPIFGLYNPSNYVAGSTIADLKQIFTNLQAASFGIIPRPTKDALEFWTPELAGNATRVFIPSLEYWNKAISRSIMMPDLLGMTHDTSQGSYARARVHFDVFLLVVEAIRKDLQTTVMQHQVVNPLIDINFPGITEYPQWSFLPVTDQVRIDLINAWTNMVTKGVVTNEAQDEQQIRKLLHFPDKSDPEAEPPSSEMYPPPIPAGATPEAPVKTAPQPSRNGSGNGDGGGASIEPGEESTLSVKQKARNGHRKPH